MTGQPHRKFGFDTVFDGAGGVAYTPPPTKRTFTAEDVEAARAEGRADGERAMRAAAETLQAQALSQIANLVQQALPTVGGLVQAHREGAAELALACGKAVADAALAQFPQGPMQAALESLAREIDAAPRIVFSLSPELVEPLTPLLEQAAQGVGYGGAVVVRADPKAPAAAFTLDFGDGSASFDPQAAAERVRAALASALAAEAGPADPL